MGVKVGDKVVLREYLDRTAGLDWTIDDLARVGKTYSVETLSKDTIFVRNESDNTTWPLSFVDLVADIDVYRVLQLHSGVY